MILQSLHPTTRHSRVVCHEYQLELMAWVMGQASGTEQGTAHETLFKTHWSLIGTSQRQYDIRAHTVTTIIRDSRLLLNRGVQN